MTQSLGLVPQSTRVNPSRCKRWLGGAVALLGLLVHGTLCADETRFQIDWHTPEDCAPAERVARKLAVLLGAPPEQLMRAPLFVTAWVERNPAGGWRTEIALSQRGETRTRRMDAGSCDELADAAALLVALAIDPEFRHRARPADAADSPASADSPPMASVENPVAPPPPPVAPPVAPLPPPSPRQVTVLPAQPTALSRPLPRRRLRTEPFIGLGPALEWGSLPHVGVGAQLSGGLYLGALRVEIASRYVTLTRPEDAEFYLASLGVRGCWLVRFGERFGLGPCGGAELGFVHAKGTQQGARAENKDWGSARLGAQAEVGITRALHLAAQGDLGVPFGRPDFWLNGKEIHRTSLVVGGATILVELRFQ